MSNPGPFDPTIASDQSPRSFQLRATTIASHFGDFELLEEIARGGMGVVYKARQISLNRIVAVKMILAGQFASSHEVQRFRTEAEAAANLQHPNIVAIYQVGDQDGQHYFSMEFVDGPNLAQIVREHLLPARLAAQIVLTITEAVHFGHQRGIIHRDLKPSNVIMLLKQEQQEGRVAASVAQIARQDIERAIPKITDFGLAKRIEGGAELTGTDQILGTPSYMPPEYAKGTKTQNGPQGDIYSLGAILYELLTARPPFRGESPLDTMLQAMESEAVRPRLLNTNVPRDLETICLKCLQKNPHDRYASAAALAEDLRRFLAGDPIQARPPGLIERSARWVLKQRRSVATALVAALVSSLVLVTALITHLAYNQWRLGYVSMNTDGTMLTAEILDPADQLAVPRFSVPTQELVALPSGPYNIRLTGPSLLSETYQLFVERAGRVEFRVPSDTRQLWDPLPVPRSYEVVPFDDRADLMLLTDSGVRRVKGTTAETIWELDLNAAARKSYPEFQWDWLTDIEQSGRGSIDRRPQLMQTPFDIDGDKTPDLVWAGRHQAFLVAVSGAKGELLWCHLDDSLAALPIKSTDKLFSESAILGRPATQDLDRDGTPDFVITCASVERDPQSNSGWAQSPKRWIECISGRTGKRLWRVELDGYFAATASPPLAASWPTSRNTWGIAGYTGSSDAGYHELHVAHLSGPSESVHVPFAAELTTVRGKAAAVLVAGSTLVCLNAETGENISASHDFGFVSLRPPILADLDGDRSTEAIVFGGKKVSMGTGRDEIVEMTAVSLPNGVKRWSVVLQATWDGFNWYDVPPKWPLVADLDKNGIPEVIVPSQLVNDGQIYDSPWGGLQVLDGRSGHARWHVRVRSLHQQVDRFVVGPDIDADGQLDLFVASTVAWADVGEKFSIFVDAISGRDGKTLWWRELPLGDSYEACEGVGIDPPFWWNTGLDGWPQLVVPYLPDAAQGVPKTFVLSAGTGRLAYTAAGVCDSYSADLDGDGTKELLSYRPNQPARFDAGGKLVAVRSATADGWQRLGGIWTSAEDLDQDGIGDLVSAGKNLTAISSRDGSVLWHSKGPANIFSSPPLPLGDFNGDGTPDILAPYPVGTASVVGMGLVPLQAISGRTGERLWAADAMTVFAGMQFLEVTDLEGDGRAEVIFVGAMDPRSLGSSTWQWWLTVFTAETGELRWKQPLSDLTNVAGQFDRNFRIQTELVDINADGVLDLVFPIITTQPNYAVRAFNGVNGQPLWTHALPPRKNPDVTQMVPLVRFGDLNGDSRMEAVIADVTQEGRCEISALDALNAKVLWTAKVPSTGLNNCVMSIAKLPLGKKQHVGLLVHRFHNPPLDLTAVVELLVLDNTGTVVARRKILPPVTTVGAGGDLWCWDLNQDGEQELLFLDDKKLVALNADLQSTFWQWPLPIDSGDPVGIWLDRKSPSIGIHIVDSEYVDRKYLLDERTGQPRWQTGKAKHTQLSFIHSNRLPVPLMVTSNEQVTICRQALPVDSATGATAIANSSASLPPPAIESRPRTMQSRSSKDDPRFIRHLPWSHMRHGAVEVALSIAICLVALILPGSMIVSAVRRHRFSLRQLFALPVVVAAVIVLFRVLASDAVDLAAYMDGFSGPLMLGWHPTAEVLNSPGWLFMLGFQGFPFVFLFATVVNSVQHQQWRRLMWLALLYGFFVVAISGSMLIYDAQQMDPRERYAWREFVWCLYPPLFMAGSIWLLVRLATYAWSAIRRVRGKN